MLPSLTKPTAQRCMQTCKTQAAQGAPGTRGRAPGDGGRLCEATWALSPERTREEGRRGEGTWSKGGKRARTRVRRQQAPQVRVHRGEVGGVHRAGSSEVTVQPRAG